MALYTLHGIPVMLMSYVGALKCWLMAPLIGVFGYSVWSLRLPVALLAAAVILLCNAIAKRWTEPGIGGPDASDIGVTNNALHSDAAFSTTKGVYVLTGYNHGPGRGVWIAFSQDGVSNWSQDEWLQHGSPTNLTLSPYVTIVNEDGTDNGVVGDTFYAYWAFTSRWDDPVCTVNAPNCGLRQLVRQKITLFAP